MLRLHVDSKSKKHDLARTYARLAEIYPNRTFFVTITANCILKEVKAQSYSLWFGHAFGSKELYLGQKVSADGVVEQLFEEYRVRDFSDASSLPTKFSTESFGEVYRRNFSSSDVVVDSLVNLVYFFSLGLDNYQRDRQLKEKVKWRRLF